MPQDGLVRVTPAVQPMLDSQRLGARPYSLSALQKFATCPYQFLLSAIYRLQPNDEPEPLQRLDPLTRGALFHEVQARAAGAGGRNPNSIARSTISSASSPARRLASVSGISCSVNAPAAVQ